MIGKAQSRVSPTALGTLVQASTYGMTIPRIIGTTRCSPLLIWAANLRQGICAAGKKGKKVGGFLAGGLIGGLAKGKKNQPQYIENVDFLIGHNPILGFLQWWTNGKLIPLTIKTYSPTWNWDASITISDAKFVAVIGVTANIAQPFLSTTFDDYGAPAPVTWPAGFSEIPLINAAVGAPDPADSPAYTRFPWAYRWRPDYGPTIWFDWSNGIEGPDGNYAFSPGVGATWNIYYAAIPTNYSFSPNAQMCVSFESQLGDGPEYTGTLAGTSTPLSSQQIIYADFAGAGSKTFSLGSTETLPSLGVEVQGSFISKGTGDADFADMIEDVIKSGTIQAGLNLVANDVITGSGAVQVGLNCNTTPNIVQKKYKNHHLGNSNWGLALDRAITAGNWLLVIWYENTTSGATAASLSSVLGNTYPPVTFQALGASPSTVAIWCGQITNGGLETLTMELTGAGETGGLRLLILEIDDMDTLDTPVILTGTVPSSPSRSNIAATIGAGNQQRQPELLIAAGFVDGGVLIPQNSVSWFDIAANYLAEVTTSSGELVPFDDQMAVQGRVVKSPGAFPWMASLAAGVQYAFVILGFRNSNFQAQAKPQNLPDIVDRPSLVQCRRAAIAGDLYGSINMNSQRKASDWLKDFYGSMNSWPVWAGFKLLSIARDEVSKATNGAIYQSNTSSGPVAVLDADLGDLVADGSNAPITVERKAQSDAYNILQIQHINRASNYDQIVTSQVDPASIAQYGVRKAAPEVHNEIQTVDVARKILAIMVRRETMLRNTYKFKANPRWSALLPGDLITVKDAEAGVQADVRIQSIQENDDLTLSMEAEPFIYALHDPLATSLPATNPAPNSTNQNVSVALVNTPVIFEPVPRLYANQNERQLWIGVSDSDANYGGCVVMLSTDGGASYNQVGILLGNATTGVSTADWPAATSPDTSNDLPLDLTESLGSLANFATSDEDNDVCPFYMAGGAGTIPYELGTYAIAQLTSTYKYTIKATGSGNHLDRAVFGAPNAGGVGVDHPSGSRFLLLPSSGQGILKLTMDQQWIGVTLHLKFLAFNMYGGAQQSLASVTDYTYAPTGQVGQVNPAGVTPQLFLINGT